MSDITNFIKSIVLTCKNIESSTLLITKEVVSAVNESETVFLIQNTDIPEFKFNTLAIRDRINEVSQRFTAFDDIKIDFKINVDQGVEEILISSPSNKFKTNFKCIRADIVTGTGRLNVSELVKPRERPSKSIRYTEAYTIEFSEKEIAALNTADNMMKSSYTTINSNEGLELLLISENGERFSYQVEKPGVSIDGTEALFAYRYNTKDFLKVLKLFGKSPIIVSDRGMLVFKAESAKVILMPIKNPVE